MNTTQYAIINPQNIVTAVTRPAFISLHFSRARRDRIVELWQKTKQPVKVGDKLQVCREKKGSASLYADQQRCWCCKYFYRAGYENGKCEVCLDEDYEAMIDAREYEERGE